MNRVKLTEHFSIAELQNSSTAAKLGIKNEVPDSLIPNMLKVATALEKIREQFGPIHVLSCYRSEELNKAVGGSSTSAHLQALAADIRIANVAPLTVCRWTAENIEDFDQVIHEFGEWTHIGFGGKGRKALLTAMKQDGKTIYLPGLQEVKT